MKNIIKMTKTTREIERERNQNIFNCSIGFTLALFIICITGFFYIQSQINDLPKRVCWNETYNESQPILEQVTCECAKEDSDYYKKFGGYCLMWCGKIIGYENVTKIKEVCEIV